MLSFERMRCTSPEYLPQKYLQGRFQTGLKYLSLAFSSMNGCVFTSNIMVLHHKKSQTIEKQTK